MKERENSSFHLWIFNDCVMICDKNEWERLFVLENIERRRCVRRFKFQWFFTFEKVLILTNCQGLDDHLNENRIGFIQGFSIVNMRTIDKLKFFHRAKFNVSLPRIRKATRRLDFKVRSYLNDLLQSEKTKTCDRLDEESNVKCHY